MPDEEFARRDGDDGDAWRRWGPHPSERAWGTVREDDSADGETWGFSPNGRDVPEPPPERPSGRNSGWRHSSNHDVISAPDTWEYTWCATRAVPS